MFDSLSAKLQGTLSGVRARGSLSEEDIDGAMREIRLALLEADVNFKVAKDLVATLKERCRDAEIVGRLNAGQQVVKIVDEGLTELMGGSSSELAFAAHPPTVILMAGLQGSGKTTACAKLARHLRQERGASVALAACDTQRPAAVDQLVILGERAGVQTYERGTEGDPVEIAQWALERSRSDGRDVLIVDTSGRLHVDEALMDELSRMRAALEPQHVLLVVDAMTGQDAVNVAERFGQAVDFDGIVMSKLDGDARGGAALSVKALSGRPIVFASTGERLEQFELFHPDRMAQRILGMGDVMSLIEKAERELDADEAQRLEQKLRRNEFGLDDFLAQLKMVRRMGPLTGLLSMIPGLGGGALESMHLDERELDRIQAIILSMTPEERRRPELVKGRRRLRIARGSGTSVQQVSGLLKQFAQMRTLMRQVSRGRMPDLGALTRGSR
jgi:signal recognition particle subunit SRP54